MEVIASVAQLKDLMNKGEQVEHNVIKTEGLPSQKHISEDS
jgi:hypothetical protein